MGVVTTLLVFSGWLRTDRGTVIRVGSLPCDGVRALRQNYYQENHSGVFYYGVTSHYGINTVLTNLI